MLFVDNTLLETAVYGLHKVYFDRNLMKAF